MQFGGRLSRRHWRRAWVRCPSEATADDHVLDRQHQRNSRLRRRSFIRRPPCRQQGYALLLPPLWEGVLFSRPFVCLSICLFVCLFVCLLTGWLKKLRIHFHEIWIVGKLRIREELFKFWEWSGICSGYFIVFVDNPLVDWCEKWKWTYGAVRENARDNDTAEFSVAWQR